MKETGTGHKDTDLTAKRRVTRTTFARGTEQSINVLPFTCRPVILRSRSAFNVNGVLKMNATLVLLQGRPS